MKFKLSFLGKVMTNKSFLTLNLWIVVKYNLFCFSVIKPVLEPPKVDPVKEEKRSSSPELARISALVTRPSNSKPTPTIPLAHSVESLAVSSFSSSPPSKKQTNNSSITADPKIKTKEVSKKSSQGESEKKEPLAFYFVSKWIVRF